MALSEIERAKILDILERLTHEKQTAEERLCKEIDFNKSVWEQYGSELCAESLRTNERRLQDKVNSITRSIELLEQYIKGIFSVTPEREKFIRGQISEAESKIKLQQELIEIGNRELAEVALVRSLLA